MTDLVRKVLMVQGMREELETSKILISLISLANLTLPLEAVGGMNIHITSMEHLMISFPQILMMMDSLEMVILFLENHFLEILFLMIQYLGTQCLETQCLETQCLRTL